MDLSHLDRSQLEQLRKDPNIGAVLREAIDAHMAELPRDGIPAGISDIKKSQQSTGPMPAVLRLLVPWTALASDNKRSAPLGAAGRAKSKEYKAALDKCRDRIRGQYKGDPCADPVRITATVFYPDNCRRDTPNFSKLLCDALKETVITDDRWQVLHTLTLTSGGIDRDAPRCEITVERIPSHRREEFVHPLYQD